LLFRFPGRVPSGGAILQPVGLVDVMPTILDLIGVRARTAMEGRSLRPVMDGGGLEPSPIFVSGRGRDAVVAWPWKMIRTGGSRFELYDLDRDPSERVDRSKENRLELRRLQAVLSKRERGGVASSGSRARLVQPDADDRERLHALGYLDGDS
jgi:arylsulfatase